MKFIILSFVLSIIAISLVSADTISINWVGDGGVVGSPNSLIEGFNTITESTSNGGTTGGTSGGSSGGGGNCEYKWSCTDWSECSQSEKQIRYCANIGTCPSTYKTPETSQSCTSVSQKTEEGNKDVNKITEKTDLLHDIKNNEKLVYSIAVLIILAIIFSLKKDYFIKRTKKVPQ